MVFSSLVFLWLFLPIVLIAYFVTKNAYRNHLLVAASLIFYAWGEPVYIAIMLLSIIVNYLVGLKLYTVYARLFLLLGITFNLTLLGIFKYYDFAIANLSFIWAEQPAFLHLALPLGISFYTFQSISYLVDVYRKHDTPQRDIIKMGLFIAFFPQLIAGPILKYHDIAPQINNRKATLADFNEGCIRFIQGLAKKVILANPMAETADAIFSLPADSLTPQTAWIGIIAYTFQIYFDFAGYSEMAIGLARMFGFKINENFNLPYTASSIRDFWHRWHISLSSWFKEYVYIPLGGNKQGWTITARNLIFVFFLTGLWHGASWNFIVWGLMHGSVLIVERIVPIERILKFKPLQITYSLFIIMITWVFFRSPDLPYALQYLDIMFTSQGAGAYSLYLTRKFIIFGIISFLASGFLELLCEHLPLKSEIKQRFVSILKPCFLLFIAGASILMLANNTYNPFIYWRF